MGTVFADTNYLVALLDPKDNLHEKARQISASLPPSRIVTTDFVLTEMLRLFSDDGEDFRQVAVRTATQLRNDPNSEVIPASRALFDRALDVYASHKDKKWDLVDCSSFVTMREKGITEALTHDEHFVQMGFRALLRET